jgi:hypothetical protein
VTIDGVLISDTIYWPITHLYTHDSWLKFTGQYHTQTSVFSLLKSPIAEFMATDFITGTITVSLNYTLLIKSAIHSRTFNWAVLQLTLFFTASSIELPLNRQYYAWRPFHTNLLVVSSQPDFQLTGMPNCFPCNPVARTQQNTDFNNNSILVETYLPRHSIATAVVSLFVSRPGNRTVPRIAP